MVRCSRSAASLVLCRPFDRREPATFRAALAALAREEVGQAADGVRYREVDDRLRLPVRADETRTRQVLDVEGQRRGRASDGLCETSCGHPVGQVSKQRQERCQTGLLRQRDQHGEGGVIVHHVAAFR